MNNSNFDAISNMSYEDLSMEAADIRNRLNRFRTSLAKYFVNREEIVDLMVVCAVAQEPLLLIGEPGTAKSDLVTKFRDALGISTDDYFEYMLTQFTEPSEIMGPIDINEMKEGRYTRRIEGKLPTATMVFLDEVFKSNSAILNSLLTVLNERVFYQNGKRTPIPLKVLIAATNEIPEQAELSALKDRFSMKAITHSVSESHFNELIDAGLAAATQRDLKQKPWIEGHATLEDVLKANLYLTMQIAKVEKKSDGTEIRHRDRYFPQDIMDEFNRLLKTIRREDGIFVSDRKIIKLYRLLATRAWLFHGGRVEKEDLILLSRLGETREQLEILEEKIPNLLGVK